MKNTVSLSFCVIALFVFAGCVLDQDVAVLENRIAALEMESTRQLNKEKEFEKKISDAVAASETSLSTSDKSAKENYAELKAEMDTLKHRMRVLTGKIEESEHRLARYSDTAVQQEKKNYQRLDNAVSRNYQRLIRLEKYMGFEPAEPGSQGQGQAQEKGPDKTEKGLYNYAKQLLDKGANDDARIQFEEFLKLYPESGNADNATFWIADSYYRDKWYEKAILEYQKVIEKYSKGNKIPAALLKQGYAFANLGEKANARLILKELVKKHPDSQEAKIAKEKIKKLQ